MSQPPTIEELIVQAETQNAAYPQYEGKFRNPHYRRIIITENVRTKGGMAFLKGDVVIAILGKEMGHHPPGDQFSENMFAYSWRNETSTLVLPKHFRTLD